MTKLLGIKELCEFWQSIKARLNGKVDKVAGKGLSTNDYTTAEKNKLAGIEDGAQVNRTYTAFTGKPTANQTPGFGDTFTLQQIKQSTTGQVSGTDRTVKIPNTAATTSDAGLMSAADKTKLNGIAAGAEVNVQSDWSTTDTNSDAYIKNKPSVYTKTESDNRYVNKSGDTMSGDLTINKATPSYLTKGTSSTRFNAAAITSSVYAGRIHFKDSNNDIAHYIESGRNTSNETWSSFIHRRTKADGSSYTNHGFYLYIQNDGGVSVGFPSTTSRDAWATGLNVVKKAGDTMTGNLTISKSGAQLYCKSTDMDSAVGQTIPSSGETMFGGIQFQDKNGYNMGWFRQYKNSNDRTYTQMLVRRHVGSSDIVNGLTLGINADGTRSVSVSESAPWRSALSVYSKTESDDRYANVSGDTFSGKAIFSGGVDIRSATHTTDPPFILTLANTFADGGNVGWISAAELRAFANKWTVLATAYNTTRKTFTNPVGTYAELLIAAYFPNMDDTSVSKYFTTVIPIGALSSNVLEVWVGGGRGNSTNGYANSGARAVCNLTQTYIQGVAASDGATSRIANTTWKVYAR